MCTGCLGVIPVVNVPLRALCAGRKGSGVTAEEAGEAGVATRRAPLGPRLTCALHWVVFMQAHRHATRLTAVPSEEVQLAMELCGFMRLASAQQTFLGDPLTLAWDCPTGSQRVHQTYAPQKRYLGQGHPGP